MGKKIYSDSQMQEMVAAYISGKTSSEAAAIHGADGGTLLHYLKKHNIPRRPAGHPKGKRGGRRLPESVELSILADYNAKVPVSEIAAKNHIRSEIVPGIVRRMGGTVSPVGSARKYTLNHFAFRTVTDESAYWAGFLLADGCVHIRGHKKLLTLALAEKDRDHLEAFRNFLQSDRPVHTYKNGGSTPGNYVLLEALSADIVDDLVKIGITPRKSLTAQPDAQFANNCHFWRGVIDGDGCLSWIKSQQGYVSRPLLGLCGSKPTCEAFAAFATTRFPQLPINVRPHKSIWSVHISGLRAARLAEELYANGPSLLRKRLIAQAFTQSYIDHPAKASCLNPS
jgi:hypothetical protein